MRIWAEAGEAGGWSFPAPALPHLPAMLEAARLDMEPAGPDAINSAVRDVLSGLAEKRMGSGDAKSQLLVYRIGLKEIPLDLLRLACVRATSVCEWRPKPKVLLDLIAEEFSERRRRLARLEEAHRRPPMPPHIISEAERAAVIDGLASLKEALDARNREEQNRLDKLAATRAVAVGNGSRAVVAAALAASKKKPPAG